MFSERLKALRNKLKIDRKEICEKLGVALTTYSNYENNNREPDFDTLIKLAKYFNVTTDYLLGITDIRNCYECRENNAEDKLTQDEEKVIQLYRKLSERNKGKAELLIEQLLEKQEIETVKTETTAKKQNKKEVG